MKTKKFIRSMINALTVLLASIAPSYSQDYSIDYAETIKEIDLKAHLSIIASDSFEGRGTGERGQKLAAEYIAAQFHNMGLTPPVKTEDSLSFYQKFNVLRKSWDDPYINIDGRERRFLKDFFSVANPDIFKEEELEVVFASFGMDDILKHKERIQGKAIVLFANKSAEQENVYNSILTSNFNRKYRELLNNGARALFIITDTNDSIFNGFLSKFKCDIEEAKISMKKPDVIYNNIFFISSSIGAEMLGLKKKELVELWRKREELSTQDLKRIKPRKIKVKASKKIETIETENVLGFLEGTDKKDEVLIITAHYDHEGIKCGEIYNGADDDGTGTVTILELVQAFTLAKKENRGPRRSILFMTVTGEEKGLLGSAYYTQNPIFPLTQTIANLNIDMIGRIDKYHEDENYIYLIGSDRLSSQLHEISEEINEKYAGVKLDYKYNSLDDPNRFYYRSDHYNFAKNNIPVIFYFSGVHEDYHKPTDDIEKILFGKVEKTARLIFHTAWELVNREERILVDAK